MKTLGKNYFLSPPSKEGHSLLCISINMLVFLFKFCIGSVVVQNGSEEEIC